MPALAFLEATVGVGWFVPSVILLSVSTLLYVEGAATLAQILPLAFCGALVGDHSGYYLGRFLGPRFQETRFAQRRAKTLKRAEELLLRYGSWAILLGRLITAARSVVPLLTGVGGMPRAKYSTYDVLACLVWSIGLGLLVLGLDKLWG